MRKTGPWGGNVLDYFLDIAQCVSFRVVGKWIYLFTVRLAFYSFFLIFKNNRLYLNFLKIEFKPMRGHKAS